MEYIGVVFTFLILALIIVLTLPEVTKKNGIIKIGTIINKKYDLDIYDLVVQAEKRRAPKSRYCWYICIYAYERNNPNICVGTHQLSVNGFEESAKKKKAKIERIIKNQF